MERSPGPWRSAAPIALALFAASGDARAQAGQEPIRIGYRAPAGCVDAGVFADQVRARTARARLAGPGEKARTFTVVVTQDRGISRGQLTIDDGEGPLAVREVSGQTCGEVVVALALISALAIDPNASTAPQPLPPPRAVQAPEPEPPRQPEPGPGPGPPAPRPHPAPVIPAPEPTAPPRPAVEPTRWRLAGGAHAAAQGGIAPDLLPALHVFLDASLTGDAGVLAPAFRVGALTGTSGRITSEVGTAAFRWTTGRAEACPLRLQLDTHVTAHPCAFLTLGSLRAMSWTSTRTSKKGRMWADVGALVRLQWVALGFLLLEGEAGLTAPITRYHVDFQGPEDTTVQSTPSVAGVLGIGAGLRFP